MSNITEEEIKLLKQASEKGSKKEWNNACDKIKQNHTKQYPDDWYKIVIKGKIISKASANIKITKWSR